MKKLLFTLLCFAALQTKAQTYFNESFEGTSLSQLQAKGWVFSSGWCISCVGALQPVDSNNILISPVQVNTTYFITPIIDNEDLATIFSFSYLFNSNDPNYTKIVIELIDDFGNPLLTYRKDSIVFENGVENKFVYTYVNTYHFTQPTRIKVSFINRSNTRVGFDMVMAHRGSVLAVRNLKDFKGFWNTSREREFTWKVMNDEGVKEYWIQESTDGRNWKTIKVIPVEKGNKTYYEKVY